MDYNSDFKNGFIIIDNFIKKTKESKITVKKDFKYYSNSFTSLYFHFHNSIRTSIIDDSYKNIEIYTLYFKCKGEDEETYFKRFSHESKILKESSKSKHMTFNKKQNLEHIASNFKEDFNLLYQLSNANNKDILDFINKQSKYNNKIKD